MPDHPVPEPKISSLQGGSTGVESDLGELAALFASRGGGGLSPEVSTDLALEVVLNEIVEQACLATGATGAAIVLLRDGEMVCRASNGANAPQLGAPLGNESGLTAECIKTRKVQRCDDAQSDPRADAEASRSLGVRSVMIFPLLRKGEIAGILEVFSPLPSAFGDRDEQTLEALTRRILQNLERASEPLSLPSNAAKNAAPPNPSDGLVSLGVSDGEESRPGWEMKRGKQEVVPLDTSEVNTRGGINFVTWALAAAVLASTLLLGSLVGIRLGWHRSAGVRGQVVKTAPGFVFAPSTTGQNTVVEEQTAGKGPTQANHEPVANALAASGNGGLPNEKNNGSAPVGKPGNEAPPGSLVVYEDGKEVFRLPPGGEAEASQTTGMKEPGDPGKVQQASALEPAAITELAPEAAEGSLLHRVEPEYPEEARQQQIQGPVVLEVGIGRDGAVEEAKLVSGQPVLANASIAAVKQWRFRPRMVEGQPVEMQTKVTLNFKLPPTESKGLQ